MTDKRVCKSDREGYIEALEKEVVDLKMELQGLYVELEVLRSQVGTLKRTNKVNCDYIAKLEQFAEESIR